MHFSIIIPTLNEEKYVTNLLDGLKTQTFTDFDAIVVDGGSNDRTVDLVKTYKKHFPLRIIVSKKQNVGMQRNMGAQVATGDYLVFFDADVVIQSDYLQKLDEQLHRTSFDFGTAKIAVSQVHLIDQLSVILTNYLFYVLNFLGRPFMGGTNLIFKNTVFTQLKGFDPAIIHAEDLELTQRAAKNHFRGAYLMNIAHVISLRRIEREGRLSLWGKYSYSFFYNLLIGPIRKPLFDYKMGGK